MQRSIFPRWSQTRLLVGLVAVVLTASMAARGADVTLDLGSGNPQGAIALGPREPFFLRSQAEAWTELSLGAPEATAPDNLRLLHAGTEAAPAGLPALRPHALSAQFEGKWITVGAVGQMEAVWGTAAVLERVSAADGVLTWRFAHRLEQGKSLSVHVRRGGQWALAGSLRCSAAPAASAVAPTGTTDVLVRTVDVSAALQKLLRVPPADGSAASAASRAATPKTVSYIGSAEYDGCVATLDLTFLGKKVSGHLSKQGVMQNNVHLTSVDVSFANLTLRGSWEDPATVIVGPWSGGDYMGGVKVASYPSSGTVTISLADRGNGTVVYLHRIATSRYGYTFGTKGKVYDLPSTNPPPGGVSKAVGDWKGPYTFTWEGQPPVLFDVAVSVSSNGAVNATLSKNSNPPQSYAVQGKWWRNDQGITIRWDNDDEDDDPIVCRLNGVDTMIIDVDDSKPIVLTRQPTSVTNQTAAGAEGNPSSAS